MGEDELVAAIAQIAGAPGGACASGLATTRRHGSRHVRTAASSRPTCLIEDGHFSRSWMSFHDIGVRAMAANLSDIAAMGARPVLATVALGIPATIENASVLECYRGFAETANKVGAAIVGGDLSRNPRVDALYRRRWRGALQRTSSQRSVAYRAMCWP